MSSQQDGVDKELNKINAEIDNLDFLWNKEKKVDMWKDDEKKKQNCSKIAELMELMIRKQVLQRATEKDGDLILKCLELCYYITKNKRNRAKMGNSDFIPAALSVFCKFFAIIRERKVDANDINHQICLLSASLLRMLARTKTGRENLVSRDGLKIFKEAVQDHLKREKSTKESKDLDAVICSLCLRCLPLKPLPINKDFPLVFVLPVTDACRCPAEDASESDEDNAIEIGAGPDVSEVLAARLRASKSLDDDAPRLSTQQSVSGQTNPLGGLSSNNPPAVTETFCYKCDNLEAYKKFCIEFGEDIEPIINEQKFPDIQVLVSPSSSAREAYDEEAYRPTLRRSSRSTLDMVKKMMEPNRLTAKNRCSSELKFNKEWRRCRNSSDPHPESGGTSPERGYPHRLHHNISAAKFDRSDSAVSMEAGLSLSVTEPPDCAASENRKNCFYDQKVYSDFAKNTKRVAAFCKLAYPDYVSAYPNLPLQPCNEYPKALLMYFLLFSSEYEKLCNLLFYIRRACRRTVLKEVGRFENSKFEQKTIYDLDELLTKEREPPELINDDEDQVGINDPQSNHLKFESRFENGNLRKVLQVGPNEYELILSNDINQILQHYMWYYFQVSNMEPDVPYVFKIVNLVKSKSLVSTGMQPCVFSVTEAKQGRYGWARCGTDNVYYRNNYIRPSNPKTKQTERCYSTTSFTISFRHKCDICYIAFHYPYTYAALKANLSRWHKLMSTRNKDSSSGSILFRKEVLANSMGGNPVHLVTITSSGPGREISCRDVIFLSARVHPGESNSSWMMQGTIDFLLSDSPVAQQARELFVFKLVPMLNPDGVINGNHRCSLAGQDLNRQWACPNVSLHPSIYHAKNLILYLRSLGKKPLVFCDYHGHSRKKNVFVYGNNPIWSWLKDDRSIPHHDEFYLLPEILEETAAGFCLHYCSFQIQQGKESSARVNIWREIGVARAYTLEASYGGFDRGVYSGFQVGTRELMEMGEKMIESLVLMREYMDCNRAPSKKFESSNGDSDDSGMA